MATKVQSAFGNTASIVINGVTAGNLLVIETSYFRGSGTTAPATPTDTNGTVSVASADSPADSGSGVGGAAIWYVKNTNSGTHTISNLESSNNTTVTEYSGSDTTNPFDVAKSSTSVVSGHTSQSTGTTATTGQANELVVICFGIGASPGAANMGLTDPVSGFTTLKLIQDDQSDIGTQHAFKNVSSTGTQAATFNWTDTSTAESSMGCIATFKDAGGGTTTTIAPPSGTDIYGGNSPAMSFSLLPTVGATVYSGNNPNFTLQLLPTVGSEVYSGNQPSLSQSILIQPSSGSISFDGLIPNLVFQLLSSEGRISYDGNAPSLNQTGGTVLHFSRRHGRVYYS